MISPEWDCTLSPESTQPTVGVELNELLNRSIHRLVPIREIGSALCMQWAKYIPNCSHLIFVVDVSDLGHLASALVLLHETLASDTTGKNILLAFNKLDLVDQRSLIAANNFMRVEDLKRDNANLSVIYGSCMDGSLCKSVLEWLTAQLST